MTIKPYWIKERGNPQLGTYYVAMGQMPTREAKKYEDALYGMNIMHRFKTRTDYESRIDELRSQGEKVQGL